MAQCPENILMVARGERGRGAGGGRGRNEEHDEDVKDSIGNTLNNMVVLCVGTRLIMGGHVLSYINVYTLCGTPKTNIILYVSFN